MKKIITILMALCLSLGLFAGCNIKLDDSTGTDDVSGEIDFNAGSDYEDTLKVWITNNDSEAELMEAFTTSFNQVYPKIDIEVERIDSLTDQLIFNAGLDSMCDIFWVTPEFISRYLEYDFIAPLSPIIEADPNFDIENLNPNCVSCCSDDGTLYVMPRDYNQVVMYYNVDMFDAAGVEYPPADRAMTQDEFVQMLADLKDGLLASDETNSYGVKYSEGFTNSMDAAILWDSLSWPIVKSFGGKIFDENGNHLDSDGNMYFDSEETYQAMRFVHDLVENQYMGSPATWSTKAGAQFLLETSPIYLHCRAILSQLITPSNAYHGIANVGVAPCPDFGDQDTYFDGSGATGYAMYSESEHKTAAWLFLKFIVSERAQEEASKTGNHVPVITSLVNDPNASWKKYTNSAFQEQYSNDPFVYKMDECYTHVRDFMQYVSPAYQSTVFERLQNCYTDCISNVKASDDAGIESEIRAFIKKYADEMKNYIEA